MGGAGVLDAPGRVEEIGEAIVREEDGRDLIRRWVVMVSMKSAKGALVSGERYVVFGLRRLIDEKEDEIVCVVVVVACCEECDFVVLSGVKPVCAVR
jgi:hypothetical protein